MTYRRFLNKSKSETVNGRTDNEVANRKKDSKGQIITHKTHTERER
jgi:hypothetical protein